MEGEKQRRTFTAVSFKTFNAQSESAYAISYVYYKNEKKEKAGLILFKPLNGDSAKIVKRKKFEVEFEKIRSLVTSSEIPVLVWDDRAIDIFNTLIFQSGEGINMKRPPRYFKVKDYAIRRIGLFAKKWEWGRIANHFNLSLSSSPVKAPDAEHIASLMLQIENTVSFPSVVAKAFCRFCDSILEDKIITLNEAIELHSFVTLISNKYSEFKKLQNVLDDVLADGKVTDDESIRLSRILHGMRKYYEKFINAEKSV